MSACADCEDAYLRVLERLGTDGKRPQVDCILESSRDAQALQVLKGMTCQLVGTQVLALLGQGVQGGASHWLGKWANSDDAAATKLKAVHNTALLTW